MKLGKAVCGLVAYHTVHSLHETDRPVSYSRRRFSNDHAPIRRNHRKVQAPAPRVRDGFFVYRMANAKTPEAGALRDSNWKLSKKRRVGTYDPDSIPEM